MGNKSQKNLCCAQPHAGVTRVPAKYCSPKRGRCRIILRSDNNASRAIFPVRQETESYEAIIDFSSDHHDGTEIGETYDPEADGKCRSEGGTVRSAQRKE